MDQASGKMMRKMMAKERMVRKIGNVRERCIGFVR